MCVLVLSGHAIPLRYIPDLSRCILFGLEADFRVRDLEMTELTLDKDFIFHVPQPTKLFFQLVTLIVDDWFTVSLRVSVLSTVSCHSLAYE